MLIGAMGWWIFGTVAAGYSLHRLCLWLERAGYLYYVNSWRKGSRGSFALALASAIDPYARRALEAHQQAQRLQVTPEPDGPTPDVPETLDGADPLDPSKPS
jgi:hypothetical protein